MSVLPLTTVVMPVRNEARFIRRSLGAVLAQDYPADRLEIIVADGMSTDDTRLHIEALGRHDPRLRLIDNPGGIVSTGLNAAIRAASGDVIVRVDGHCEIAPDYVRRSVDQLRRFKADGVGGPLDTVGETPWAQVIAAAMSSPFGVGNSSFRVTTTKTAFVDTVAFPAYTREALRETGAFDEELVRNQDDEYDYRLRKRGGKLLLASDVRARYYSRSSLASLWRQYLQYGYWKVRVMQKHPRQMSLRQFVPVTFVAALLISAALTPFLRPAGLLAIAILASYATANLAASWTVSRRLRERMALRLVLAFTALHVAYGAGFLKGLVAFRNRW